ncbi:MAG: hypothetical protein V3U02_05790, partial [Calditrichia bacterium]
IYLKGQYRIKNKIMSQKRSIEQIENLINRRKMPEESKTGLLTALDNVGKFSDNVSIQIESEIEFQSADLDIDEVVEIENLASGMISDATLSRLVADWNEMASMGGKLDGCYNIFIRNDGKDIQHIWGVITNGKLTLIPIPETGGNACFTQTIHSDDVLDIIDAIDNQDFGELLKIGKRYGYGITDVMGMARDRGIELDMR